MVTFRDSLENLVITSWRERWSEYQWSVNLKAALKNECCALEVNNLCALIIQYATMSDEPNHLMFNYLNFTISSEIALHATFLEAMMNYNDLQKERCTLALLEIFDLFKSLLKPKIEDSQQGRKFCQLIRNLLTWYLDALIYYQKHQSQTLVASLASSMNFFLQPFIGFCLYFDSLENTVEFGGVMNKTDGIYKTMKESTWVTAQTKTEFRAVSQRLLHLDELQHVVDANIRNQFVLNVYLNSDPHQATIICLAVLYGSSLLAESIERIVDSIVAVSQVQELRNDKVIRDFIRGALLLQQESCWPVPDSHMTAFAYLKIPRILYYMVDHDLLSINDILVALEQLAHSYSLFNTLDMRSRCDCLKFFLDELLKHNLIQREHIPPLLEIRSVDKVALTDNAPGSQASVSLVLKAEPTLQTLLKSFHSEFAQKQDKLVQMMHHMISGKSFEFICAAAAATERLSTFAGKLVDFNESSKCPAVGEKEKSDDTLLRIELFDLSFLLLSRIVQLYTYRPIFACSSDPKCFFVALCTSYFNDEPTMTDDQEKMDTEPSSSTALTAAATKMKESVPSGDENIASEMWRKLKANQSLWSDESLSDWSLICKHIPALGDKLLSEFKDDAIIADDCKNIFNGLLYVNINGTTHWMCSMLLCLVHWLIARPGGDERKKCAGILSAFVDSVITPSTGERNKLTDRQTFMANVTKRLLSPLLAPEPIPSPSSPWLFSVGAGSPNKALRAASVGSYFTPNVDLFRQQFSAAQKQGWLPAVALKVVALCNNLEQQKFWIKICLEEFKKLSAVEEMILWTELALACCCVSEDDTSFTSAKKMANNPGEQLRLIKNCTFRSVTAFIDYLITFVLDAGYELFSVAPRGLVLSKFLLRLYIFAFQTINRRQSVGKKMKTSDEPSPPKLRRIEMDCGLDYENQIVVAKEDEEAYSCITRLLASLYEKFEQICSPGNIKPGVFFVAAFLHYLSKRRCPESALMRSLLPGTLLPSIIETDPDILPINSILSLYHLKKADSRNLALKNIFLLHLKKRFGSQPR